MQPEIVSIRPSQLLNQAVIAQMTNRFLFILGRGGAGKTTMVAKKLAPAMGRRLFEANLNGMGPTEVTGYGWINDTKDMKFAPPECWPTYDRVGDEPVLLFLDEIPDYDESVRALLRSLHPASGDRRIGPHRLGTNVFVVLAGNRRSDGTKAAVEEAPMTERCLKVVLEPDVNDWIDWYDSEPSLMSTGSHVPAFLRYGVVASNGGEVDHFNPPIRMPYDGSPHPCPRQWEAVAKAEPARKTMPADYAVAVQGLVGVRSGLAYLAFLQHVDMLPSIEDLRANPDRFSVPSDPAAQFALVSACMNAGMRGVKDAATAVHTGGFDWLVSLLLRCRGDIREFGAMSAVRRGIPLDQHIKSRDLILA